MRSFHGKNKSHDVECFYQDTRFSKIVLLLFFCIHSDTKPSYLFFAHLQLNCTFPFPLEGTGISALFFLIFLSILPEMVTGKEISMFVTYTSWWYCVFTCLATTLQMTAGSRVEEKMQWPSAPSLPISCKRETFQPAESLFRNFIVMRCLIFNY